MIRINLLPARIEKRKENIKRQISIYLLSIIFVLLCCFYLNQMQTQKIKRLEAIKEEKKKELRKYQRINRKIRELQAKIREYQKKIDVIKKIAKYRLEPIKILDELVMAIPRDRLWFDSLSYNGKKIFINGGAKDNDTVALFMKRLKSMPHIKDVILRETKLVKLDKYKLNIREFSLECDINVPKEKK